MVFKSGIYLHGKKVGKTWLSLLTSLFLGPFVSQLIERWIFSSALTNGINRTLNDLVANSPDGYNLEELFSKFPEGIIKLLEHYNISLPELTSIYGSSTEATQDIIRVISERIAAPAAQMAGKLAGHVACFIAAELFVFWLDIQIKKNRKPFWRRVDIINGVLMGVVVGACVALGVSIMTHMIFQVIVAFDGNSTLLAIYDKSYIFKFLCEFNILSTIQTAYPG